jgi:hypothetical protein
MKTQISRASFDPAQRYSGVYQQQGRMVTDADWNELAELGRTRLEGALADAVASGAPAAGGAGIEADGSLRPGTLYVDGIPARIPGSAPFAYAAQPDLPQAPPLPAGQPCVLYADVWERVVTFLEDPALLDAGLAGADTCTRMRTMCQVKWAADDAALAALPAIGAAQLEVRLREEQTATDPCDPCAEQVDLRQDIGNHLLRVEVHDLRRGAAGPIVTLKWSRENGAEHHAAQPAADMAPGFVAPGYAYEFYDLAAECHLGVLPEAGGFVPARGLIVDAWPDPLPAARPWVRRWDGYAELEHDGAAWVCHRVRERGRDIVADLVLAADRVTLPLTQHVLDWRAAAATAMLAGDFWLATVRSETVNQHLLARAEDPAFVIPPLLASSAPAGVRHHYLRLAALDAAGNAVAVTDGSPEWRRQRFPPLSALNAPDIGYAAVCPSGLFDATHNTVQKALDRVCSIQAEHVGFIQPCNTSIFQGAAVTTVAQALALLCDVRAEQIGFTQACNTSLYRGAAVTTVAGALQLLCDIRAEHIGYAPSAACAALNPAMRTVAEALDALCARPAGGGCRITVGQGGQFPDLPTAIAALLNQGLRTLCLCLLPGEHVIAGGLRLAQPGVVLELHGCGAATRVRVVEPLVFSGLAALAFAELELFNPQGSVQLRCQGCDMVRFTGVAAWATANDDRPLLAITGAWDVHLERCEFEAHRPASFDPPRQVFAGLAPFDGLFDAAFDRRAFLPRADRAGAEAAALELEPRRALVQALVQRIGPLNQADPFSQREIGAWLRLLISLQSVAPTGVLLAGHLVELRDTTAEAHAGSALALVDGAAETVLAHNRLRGALELYGMPAPDPLNADERGRFEGQLRQGFTSLMAGSGRLEAHHNQLARLRLGAQMLAQIRQRLATDQAGPLEGLHATQLWSDNALAIGNAEWLAAHAGLAGTQFEDPDTNSNGVNAGWVYADTALYTGNRAVQNGDQFVLFNVTRQAAQAAANLVFIAGL